MKTFGSDTQLSEIGAVPVRVRLHRMEFIKIHSDIFSYFDNPKNELAIGTGDREYKKRAVAALGSFSHCMRTAFSASLSYFQYMKLRQKFQEEGCYDVATATLDLAHTFADVVPIELFNAMELSKTTEFQSLMHVNAEEASRVFEQHFPNTKQARDAICHYHDRALGMAKSKVISKDHYGRCITCNGKIFTNQIGVDFEYEFKESQFEAYLKDMKKFVFPCV